MIDMRSAGAVERNGLDGCSELGGGTYLGTSMDGHSGTLGLLHTVLRRAADQRAAAEGDTDFVTAGRGVQPESGKAVDGWVGHRMSRTGTGLDWD